MMRIDKLIWIFSYFMRKKLPANLGILPDGQLFTLLLFMNLHGLTRRSKNLIQICVKNSDTEIENAIN